MAVPSQESLEVDVSRAAKEAGEASLVDGGLEGADVVREDGEGETPFMWFPTA